MRFAARGVFIGSDWSAETMRFQCSVTLEASYDQLCGNYVLLLLCGILGVITGPVWIAETMNMLFGSCVLKMISLDFKSIRFCILLRRTG